MAHWNIWYVVTWCAIYSLRSVAAQGMYYTHKNVNSYEIINGRLQHKPSTTPEPSLLETIFPWMGDSFESSKTPEEDAAILASISDSETSSNSTEATTESQGISSWFSLPSLGLFSSSTPTEDSQKDYGKSPPNDLHTTKGQGNGGQYATAASQTVPVVIPPPDKPQYPYSSMPFSPSSTHESPSPYASVPNQISHEVRENVKPSFEFHQKVKDSIPVPPLKSVGFGSMFPYPYQLSVGFPPPATESSLLNTISNYFTFGKRSDVDEPGVNGRGIQKRKDSQQDYDDADDESSSEDADDDSTDHKEDIDTGKVKDSSKDFPCPKSGVWNWNGEVCIALGPVPVWACKPNDLIVSGKIAICRNKIYFSPKVIPTRNAVTHDK